MKKRRLLIIISLIVSAAIICGLIYRMTVILKGVNTVVDFEAESLRWSIIGAIGSWAGSIFGAIALIISILAFLLPQKVRIKVETSTGFMLSQVPGVDRIDAYIVTVSNVGIKPVFFARPFYIKMQKKIHKIASAFYTKLQVVSGRHVPTGFPLQQYRYSVSFIMLRLFHPYRSGAARGVLYVL